MIQFLIYIDPGSGSMLLQIIAGAILGAGVVVKTYWTKIKSFFGKGDDKTTEKK
jgi:hypothetical protein